MIHFIPHGTRALGRLELYLPEVTVLLDRGCQLCKRLWERETLHVYFRSIERPLELRGLIAALDWRRQHGELPDGTSVIIIDRKAAVCDNCWEDFLLQVKEVINGNAKSGTT